MAFGQINMSSLTSMMGVSGLFGGSNPYDNLLSVSNNMAGNSSTSLISGSASTASLAGAYTATDLNAYNSYLGSGYSNMGFPGMDITSLFNANVGSFFSAPAPAEGAKEGAKEGVAAGAAAGAAVGAAAAGAAGVAAAAKDGAAAAKDGAAAANGAQQTALNTSNLCTSYLKSFYPNLTDDQIAGINAYYDQFYGQLESAFADYAASQGNALSMTSVGMLQGTQWGKELAEDAEKNNAGTHGWCLRGVAQALSRHGVHIGGASAYMAADQLAKIDKFTEVTGLSDADLKKLPAGAIVVWDRGNGHEHGHICISLGDGREVSDHVANMTQNYGTSFRVFLPNS
ncbi:MAG: hypothetical protein K6G50_00445 [bacterium]|nr:hypothetical protein [bacterium]